MLFFHENNKLEYQRFGIKEKTKGGQRFSEVRESGCSDDTGNKKDGV